MAEREKDYDEALSQITYLSNKFSSSKELKKFRIESLAKTGETDTAASLLKTINNPMDPDLSYLKGMIELYSGDSSKAKNYFM